MQTITAKIQNFNGRPEAAEVSFSFSTIETFAADFRLFLDDSGVSSNYTVDIDTSKQSLLIDRGRKGYGTYEISTGPRFPDVTVELSGKNGDAFSIIGATARELRRGGASPAQVDAFRDEAMSGDYDNLLQTAMRWVNVV